MPYYAVKSGRVPGVYKDWATCQEQIKQFPKAAYKKFNSEEEAWDFVNGVSDKSALSDLEDSPDHTQAIEAVEMLRKSANVLRATAQQLLSGIDKLSGQIDQVAIFIHDGNYASASGSSRGAGIKKELKRPHRDVSQPDTGDEEAGPSQKAKNKKLKPASVTDCGFTGSSFADNQGVAVYTDGASFCNGRASARAGIGVYWGNGDTYNCCERLPGRQTNNRAEIHAAVKAAQQAKVRGIKNLILHTDSQFLINGITKWIKKWKRNGWKLSTGGDVINKEDFEKLDEEITGLNIKWMHVVGHKGIEGNEAADRLANEGAKKP